MKHSFLFVLLLATEINLTSCIVINDREVVIPDISVNKTNSNYTNCDTSKQTIISKNQIIDNKIEVIKISSAINLTVSKGIKSNVRIEAGDNDIEKIQTEIYNGILLIGTKPNSCITTKIDILLTTNSLNAIKSFESTGSSSTTIEDSLINSNQLNIGLSGSSKLGITQTTGIDSLEIKVSGASKHTIDISKVNNLVIDASGASSSNIKSNSINKASLNASGASTISTSSITTAEVKASGASTIKLQKSNISELPHTKLLGGIMVWASCFVDCCSS